MENSIDNVRHVYYPNCDAPNVNKVKVSWILLAAMIAAAVPLVILATIGADPVFVLGLTAVVLVLLAAALIFIASCRRIALDCDETGFTVSGPMVRVTVPYGSVSSAEIRNNISIGIRVAGYGGVRYAGGNFANKEFGAYKLAVDSKNKNYIIISHSGKTLVFNLGTEDETYMAYNTIASRSKL
jgi:hypothetical protein